MRWVPVSFLGPGGKDFMVIPFPAENCSLHYHLLDEAVTADRRTGCVNVRAADYTEGQIEASQNAD